MTSAAIRNRFLAVSAAALLLGPAGALPASAATTSTSPTTGRQTDPTTPMNRAEGAQLPPGHHTRAECQGEARSQGLMGAEAKAFVARCTKA